MEPVRSELHESQQRYLELLVRAGEIFEQSIDYHETIQNVCEAVVDTIADICLLDLGAADSLHLAAAAHRQHGKTAQLVHAGQHLRNVGIGRSARHPVWDVIKTEQPVLVARVDDAYIRDHSTGPDHERFMRNMGYKSMIVAPLRSRSQGILGALTLVRTIGNPYTQSDVAFAMDLARRCAMAISKSLLYTQTQHIAMQFQQAALPRSLPEVRGIGFDAFYEPSSHHMLVGGDWYDAFKLPCGRIAITIGDVLGHGTEAAVWMSRLRNTLRATLYTDPDAARALVVADRLLRLDSPDDFSTALIAIIDPVHQTLSCASAGHPGPLLWEPGGGVLDPLREHGLPLGIRELADGPKTAETVTLYPGTFAVFFTDGLLEWNRDIAFAWDTVVHAMQHPEVRDALHPAKMLRDAVIGANEHQDDVAILTLRVKDLVRAEARP